ncbi:MULTISPECIES: hypothetical protein [unclassified Microbacterium]|uniref:hypothetical protein n=1 Tax=unclassified Microbacterium TaxID=2609290 RepID=UPI000EA9BBD5|nr:MULTISPECIES: hypothetical protein [unclassified Microbacterium]MBT2484183.1 hypothetical protein [Microbacterium sp. ISL-108]RKN67120.1 hypothetical protein D7252_05670 [Microbacterium sp. CGR2]
MTKAVQTGDPARVDAGLALFADTFNRYVSDLYANAATEVEQRGPGVQPLGSTWAVTETWLAAVTAVAAGGWAVVFAAVAGFHLGAAVTVIVAVYLPSMEGGFSTLEQDNVVDQISSAIG